MIHQINPNWTRWIHASILTFFTRKIVTEGKTLLYVEGQSRHKVPPAKDSVEVRWNGPFIRQYCHRIFDLDVQINFVVNSKLSREDTFTHKQLVGLVQAACETSISVYKLGTGELDDQSLLGCLILRVDNKSGVFTNYFGQFQDSVDVEQSTVEADYKMTLTVQEN